jgi:ABC-type transport system involved in cytochrome bd biosynthesis fused ATPase/permease subunit
LGWYLTHNVHQNCPRAVIWALTVAVANATRAMVACMVARRLTEVAKKQKQKRRKKLKNNFMKHVLCL